MQYGSRWSVLVHHFLLCSNNSHTLTNQVWSLHVDKHNQQHTACSKMIHDAFMGNCPILDRHLHQTGSCENQVQQVSSSPIGKAFYQWVSLWHACCSVLWCATHGSLGGLFKGPKNKLRIQKLAGIHRQKSTVGSELPLVKISRKSVHKSPVKIGPEVGHFSQCQQYLTHEWFLIKTDYWLVM